ncbi:hypothetical protein P5673_017249 [Acropora cervicornis]|uniref:DDE Tnp4 domain-containing protein n=1 Tax=Acropora cervicornis TaxID=6130 RepID=A0AAD9QFB6_ACRCE|nr:hypothetical protein P5673_017249 [Acropora cervicornis]
MAFHINSFADESSFRDMGFGHRNCVVVGCPNSGKRKTLPKKFRKPGYSKVRHIIECTELFIETPSDPALNAATWSDYKHHHTAIYCSWGGRTSDVHVTRESGFYDILEQHDEVMADRGFTIAEDLLLQHAKLHIPPGKRGWEQFSKSEVKKTKEIANLRILLSKPYED